MQDKDWRKEFTFYSVSLYRNGYYTEAALIGCVMFEKAVYYLLEQKGCRYSGVLVDAVTKMCDLYEFDTSMEDYIHKLRKDKRNPIIHNKDLNKITKDDLNNIIDFIWKVFDPESYKKYEGKIFKIEFKIADYAIRSVRRPLIRSVSENIFKNYDFKHLQPNDFKELNKLREKFITLKSKLSKDFLADQYNDLKIDYISQIDTTSAYVWMAINSKTKEKDRINTASISVLGTPLDLRIYMDFGGQALQARQDYYRFLKSDIFRSFWFKEKIDINELRIFNIDWYCFINENFSLKEFLTDQDLMKNQTIKAKNRLKPYDFTKNNIISWNCLLCGYIIKRPERKKIIFYKTIEEKLTIIINFYYSFREFQTQKS